MAGPIVLKPFVMRSDEENRELTIEDTGTSNRVIITQDGIANRSIESDNASFDLLPEGKQTGLSATSTGVQYEGDTSFLIEQDLTSGERSVFLESATISSAGNESVSVELYDASSSSVLASLTISGGSRRSRSGNIANTLTDGNEVYARFSVDSASGTSGATFDAVMARLIIK